MDKRPEFEPGKALRRHFGAELEGERRAIAGISPPAPSTGRGSAARRPGLRAGSVGRAGDFLAVAALAAILGAAAFLEAGGLGPPRGAWDSYGVDSMESCLRDYGTALGRAAKSFSAVRGGPDPMSFRGRFR